MHREGAPISISHPRRLGCPAATARLAGNPLTQTFTALAASVREKDLRASYADVLHTGPSRALVLALGGVVTGVILLGSPGCSC